MQFRTIGLRRDPTCPACGTREIRELQDYDAFCGVAPAGAEPDDELDDDLPELSPRELAARLARGDRVQLIDVREPYEYQIARLPGARLVPLRTLEGALPTLDRDRETVVHCHHGMRSAAAVELLWAHGFRRVWNLAGGIDRWSDEVDPAVPKY